MYFLTKALNFPPAEDAGPTGLLAIGGDLSADRLMLAYRSGIFPWFDDDEPILWWSPERRMVVVPCEYRPHKSLRNIINRKVFAVTFNQEFDSVIEHCRKVPRKGQRGTWLTSGMVDAYKELHRLGYAKSVEVWANGELVGGLYGVDLGHVFCGESMFSTVSNASKVGFVALVRELCQKNYQLLDCQLHNDHLQMLGAHEISRREYLKILAAR